MLRAFGSGSLEVTELHEVMSVSSCDFFRRDLSQQNVLCDHVVTLALGCSRVSLYS